MDTKQVNLKMPKKTFSIAEEYAETYGYRNVQDLLMDSLREKIYEKSNFDESFTEKEIDLIDNLIEKSIIKKKIVDEKELMKALE